MGKAAKEHRKRVQARNLRIEQEKKKREKFQREFIMNLIKQEQEKGMFDNNPNLDGMTLGSPTLDGPTLGTPITEGLSSGPMIDGPTLDIPTLTIEEPVKTEGEVVIESPVTEETKETSEN